MEDTSFMVFEELCIMNTSTTARSTAEAAIATIPHTKLYCVSITAVRNDSRNMAKTNRTNASGYFNNNLPTEPGDYALEEQLD